MMKREDSPIQDDNIQNNSGYIPEVGCDESHHSDSDEIKHDIPKFDLAEQILAAQRKVSSFKRTAPSRNRISDRKSRSNIETEIKKQDAPVPVSVPALTPEPIHNPIPIPIPINETFEDKIISEIVARDILQFRSGRIAK